MYVDRRLRLVAAASGTLLALALGGCGGSGKSSGDAHHTADAKPTGFASKSGTDILSTAIGDMTGVRALRIKGTVVDGGTHLRIDVRSDGTGRCAGTMGTGAGTARFVSTKDAVYLKGNRAFWVANGGKDAGAALTYLHGRWAKLAAAKEMSDLCHLNEGMVEKFKLGHLDQASDKGVTVGSVQTFAGLRVVEVTAKDGNDRVRMMVAVDAPHYLVRLVSEASAAPASLVFSDFGKKTPIDVPGSGEYVEMH